MTTVWDWLTVTIFAGLIAVFLQRSMAAEPDRRSIPMYGVAAIGCALTNTVGNAGHPLIAFVLLAATLGFTLRYLDPFAELRRR